MVVSVGGSDVGIGLGKTVPIPGWPTWLRVLVATAINGPLVIWFAYCLLRAAQDIGAI